MRLNSGLFCCVQALHQITGLLMMRVRAPKLV
jgi:hypothetical protein